MVYLWFCCNDFGKTKGSMEGLILTLNTNELEAVLPE
jgi:hypothetical protein